MHIYVPLFLASGFYLGTTVQAIRSRWKSERLYPHGRVDVKPLSITDKATPHPEMQALLSHVSFLKKIETEQSSRFVSVE